MSPTRPTETDAAGTPVALAADAERLGTLNGYRILDTEPEAAFDELVRQASRACAAPVALVTLVDRARQWFKARHGLDRTETVLDQSVCAHALGGRDLLVIPDLSRDPRTAANPLVTGGSHLRFYAGAPLVAPNGHVLGTLCVVDDVPRPDGLSPEQAESLRALAGEVMRQIERRRAAPSGGSGEASGGPPGTD
ncbi:GAF domain-containing protein [Aureimonas flava]|uniref:GAF domain-containing protein n=1 Tax=Aureimonas flava TaxID=2320271 RepID=A0A3A1WPF2_9HYPH|nr:GAF domain-containing protein [Aureimonas flava]RIY02652.1 GAF domain-containing protein [Aureimonas flava]